MHRQTDMSSIDALSIDWRVRMDTARSIVGPHKVLQGNVDRMVLYSSEQLIRNAVHDCMHQAGERHILNLGHGVEKDVPESAVQIFVDAGRLFML